ncbi:MAG: hypothetical protein M3Q93_01660 [Gemmatimonadota bacterium]|nr:hypothetical protein [Gemmatimonadota bacterium]
MIAALAVIAALSFADSAALSVTFTATGGTVTARGLYTAGGTAGAFRVIVTYGTIADTSVVRVGSVGPPASTAPPTSAAPAPAPTRASAGARAAAGVPFGVFNVMPGAVTMPFDLSVVAGDPGALLGQLATAQANGTRVIVNFAGGKYSRNYGIDGYFSFDVWKSRVDRFRGVDLAPYIADGTLFANYLIDEPHHGASWGGRAVAFETLERMAQYSKSIWPGLMTITRTRVSWLHRAPFRWEHLDAGWAQYAVVRGEIQKYRAVEVAAAKASGLGLLFGLNSTNGGMVVSGCHPGSREGECAMTAEELLRFGRVLAADPSSCGLTFWQYDAAYFGRDDIRASLAELAALNRVHAPTECRGG